MATLVGHPEIFHTDSRSRDTSVQVPLGSRALDANGNEFIYIQGTASVSAGSWVVFDANNANYSCELLGTYDKNGPVAIFGTAVVAGQYGWAQIFGKNNQASSDTMAARRQLYIDGTAGRVDDADAAGSAVVGAVSLSADSSNVGTVWINYPYVTGGAAID